MSQIQPNNPELLTDDAVDHSQIQCCGDENLVFLKCPHCGHIWIECYECSTWFTDLGNLESRQSCYLGHDDQRVQCPLCNKPFEDFHYLENGTCDAYLPTLQEVQDAGWTDFLDPEFKSSLESNASMLTENQPTPRKKIIIPVGANRGMILGAGIGTSSWIIMIAIMLVSKGMAFGAIVCLLCATSVLVVGFLIVSRATQGQLISLFRAALLLLGASFLFGLSALLILESRDELEPVLDENNQLPLLFNYAAPLIVLIMIGIVCSPPLKGYLKRFFV